jgi:hypothetical protein
MNGTTAEDKALQWLLNTDPLQLLPTSEANKTRLRQRFALLTFGFQPSGFGQVVHQSQYWNLATVDECAWSGFSCESEQVTSINAEDFIITGTLPPDLSWLTAMKSVSILGTGIGGHHSFIDWSLDGHSVHVSIWQQIHWYHSFIDWSLDRHSVHVSKRQPIDWHYSINHWSLDRHSVHVSKPQPIEWNSTVGSGCLDGLAGSLLSE